MRGGSEKSGGVGGGHHGGGGFRSGARSPGLPSPNTLLLRSLSSSSAISRVSSHFSHFNSNAAPVELQLPSSFRRRNSGADSDEGVRMFGGGSGGDHRDGKVGASGGALDVRAARAKYLGTGAAGGSGAAVGAGGAEATDNASRAAKSKPQWGWGAGKSLFGKRGAVEVKKAGTAVEPEAVAAIPAPAARNSTSVAAAAAGAAQAAAQAATAAAAAAAAANAALASSSSAAVTGGASGSSGDREKARFSSNSSGGAGAGGPGTGGGGGSVLSVRSREGADTARKTADTRRQGGRRLASETGGISREPGGERSRGSRSAAEQRSGLDRDGSREAADVRVRDRRPRQSRSVDSPGRVAKGTTNTADAAVEAAHGFFSVPAASYTDTSRETSKERHGRERSASTENEDAARRDRRESDRQRRVGDEDRRMGGAAHRSGGGRERGYGETRSEAKKRRSPVQAGTRRERESSRRPSRTDRTRTRSEERLSSGDKTRREGKQWSDVANPRPPLPHPSPAPEAYPLASSSRRTGGGSGAVSAASPANSSNGTSDDKSRVSRMDDNSSSAGWGTSSLAGWGETMAAEAEAEVLGHSRDKHGSGGVGGGGGGGRKGRGDAKTEEGRDTTLPLQPERTRLHQMVAALTDLCMYLVGVSPLSMEDCPTMLEVLPNDDDDWDEVSSPVADKQWYQREGRICP